MKIRTETVGTKRENPGLLSQIDGIEPVATKPPARLSHPLFRPKCSWKVSYAQECWFKKAAEQRCSETGIMHRQNPKESPTRSLGKGEIIREWFESPSVGSSICREEALEHSNFQTERQ